MKLVILAAGHGKRFGGLKQIAPIGPNGEAIMDYTVRFAEEVGYEGIVLVVREEIRDQLREHVRARWNPDLSVEIVSQPAQQGTVFAVLCARPFIEGPFAVANADDLYEGPALRAIRSHFEHPSAAGSGPSPHVLVAYQLAKTVLTNAEVKRGICRLGPEGRLEHVAEHRVRARGDGRFEASPLGLGSAPQALGASQRLLSGDEPVSMNLWGFGTRIFRYLEAAAEGFDPGEPDNELLLPAVVGTLVRGGTEDVRVVATTSHCYGVTHREDVALVREHLDTSYRAVPALAAEAGA